MSVVSRLGAGIGGTGELRRFLLVCAAHTLCQRLRAKGRAAR